MRTLFGFVFVALPLLLGNVGALRAAEIATSGLNADRSLAHGDVLAIRQTWSQEPNGFVRTADVLVPSGEGPFPVVILLHGMGGDGSKTFIREAMKIIADFLLE